MESSKGRPATTPSTPRTHHVCPPPAQHRACGAGTYRAPALSVFAHSDRGPRRRKLDLDLHPFDSMDLPPLESEVSSDEVRNAIMRIAGAASLLGSDDTLAERHRSLVNAIVGDVARVVRFFGGSPEQLEPPEPPKPRGQSSPRSVLVVEDHDLARELLATQLAQHGYDVLVAPDARSGIDLLAENLDAAIVDIGLPDAPGFEVARAARRLAARLPTRPCLIALTGFATLRDEQTSLEAGFDHHVTKPCDVRALVHLIDAFASAERADATDRAPATSAART